MIIESKRAREAQEAQERLNEQSDLLDSALKPLQDAEDEEWVKHFHGDDSTAFSLHAAFWL